MFGTGLPGCVIAAALPAIISKGSHVDKPDAPATGYTGGRVVLLFFIDDTEGRERERKRARERGWERERVGERGRERMGERGRERMGEREREREIDVLSAHTIAPYDRQRHKLHIIFSLHNASLYHLSSQ